MYMVLNFNFLYIFLSTIYTIYTINSYIKYSFLNIQILINKISYIHIPIINIYGYKRCSVRYDDGQHNRRKKKYR